MRALLAPAEGQVLLRISRPAAAGEGGSAAARELREETGFAGGPAEFLGTVEPNPAILSNRCHTYRIRGARRVAAQAPDPGEDLAVVTMPREEVPAAIADGRITHALVVCAPEGLRRRLRQLGTRELTARCARLRGGTTGSSEQRATIMAHKGDIVARLGRAHHVCGVAWCPVQQGVVRRTFGQVIAGR